MMRAIAASIVSHWCASKNSGPECSCSSGIIPSLHLHCVRHPSRHTAVTQGQHSVLAVYARRAAKMPPTYVMAWAESAVFCASGTSTDAAAYGLAVGGRNAIVSAPWYPERCRSGAYQRLHV